MLSIFDLKFFVVAAAAAAADDDVVFRVTQCVCLCAF